MFSFRRRHGSRLRGVTFCDARAEVCTPERRAEARYDRVRTAALTHTHTR